jgi:uncharacterized protein YbbK (DUF523 family)
MALLKEGSPSCGSGLVHDGTFLRWRIPGSGVATALLRRAGIRVFSEGQLGEAEAWLRGLEEPETDTRRTP